MSPGRDARIFRGSATDKCLREMCDELKKGISRLSMLQAHDAMIILRNSLSIPKLMYILRTADCCDNELLTQFDNLVSKGISTILTCELSEDQLLQASLPDKSRGLGFRSSSSLAPSAFLASAAETKELQAIILAQVEKILQTQVPDFTRNRVLERWKAISGSLLPPDEVYGK